MLLAVNIGSKQPFRLVLSKRRSIRRLRSASFRCMLAFTRNPSGASGVGERRYSIKHRKSRGISRFHTVFYSSERTTSLVQGLEPVAGADTLVGGDQGWPEIRRHPANDEAVPRTKPGSMPHFGYPYRQN